MSDVPKIACTICDPSAGDIQRIRRPITVTSQEIVNLVQHILSAHTSEGEVNLALAKAELAEGIANTAQETADTAMKIAQDVYNTVNPSPAVEEDAG